MSNKKEKFRVKINNLVREARRQLDMVSKGDKNTFLSKSQKERETGEELSSLFGKVKDSPCASCATPCCGGGNGYFSARSLHIDITTGKVDLMDYYVGSTHVRLGDRTCVFLDPNKGCNIPSKYRSNTCLGYKCGKMIDAIEENNMTSLVQLKTDKLMALQHDKNDLFILPYPKGN